MSMSCRRRARGVGGVARVAHRPRCGSPSTGCSAGSGRASSTASRRGERAVVLGQAEAILGSGAPSRRPSPGRATGRPIRGQEHPQPLLLGRAPRVDVAQGHEVEHVIGMHVADDDGIQLVRVVPPDEAGRRRPGRCRPRPGRCHPPRRDSRHGLAPGSARPASGRARSGASVWVPVRAGVGRRYIAVAVRLGGSHGREEWHGGGGADHRYQPTVTASLDRALASAAPILWRWWRDGRSGPTGWHAARRRRAAVRRQPARRRRRGPRTRCRYDRWPPAPAGAAATPPGA